MPDFSTEALGTLLVVDDMEFVRDAVVAILENANYRVLAAPCGVSAIQLAQDAAVNIDLLISDVDMPSMTGPQLGDVLTKMRPKMRVLLMSGQHGGDLDLPGGWAFIAKPFVPANLVRMITEMLCSQDQAAGHSGMT